MPTSSDVYVEELPNGAHTITGVPTSITAFVGAAPHGPVDEATRIYSFAEFEQKFGGLSRSSTMSYAVNQFFDNGGADALIVRVAKGTTGEDGTGIITDAEISDPGLEQARRGIWALESESIFNLLCIPPLTFGPGGDVGAQTRLAAAAYCKKRCAFFVADPLAAWVAPSDLIDGANNIESVVWGMPRNQNTAVYFPRIVAADPLQGGLLTEFAPSGAVAGVYSRFDRESGVWKAPAGMAATLRGVSTVATGLTDADNQRLNPLGVNCLRVFPNSLAVVWGARTLLGADSLGSEWKYVPVRRCALFLEQSISRGTQWAVFEPNDEALWAQIRLSVGAFMQTLFRQGAFQGRTPREAYFVKCDRETNTQEDIDRGIVRIAVGFAPLKPGEFIIINFQQRAGQVVA